MWDLKYDTNEQKEIHRHRKQTYDQKRGKVVGEGLINSLRLADTNNFIQKR